MQLSLNKNNVSAEDLTAYAVYYEGKILLEFDTIEELGYSRSVEITEYPFESEAGKTKITEYLYNNPDIIKMKGIKTEDSLLSSLITSALDIDSAIDVIKQQLDILISGIYKLQIMTKNGLRKYFTLMRYNMPENLNNYGLLEVEMTFKQVLTSEDWNEQQRSIDDLNTQNSGNLLTETLTSLI